MPLQATLWFPSIIYAGLNQTIDKDFLKETALHWKSIEPDPEYSSNSNEGGWHGRSIEDINTVEEHLKDGLLAFKSELDKEVDFVRKEIDFPELEFQNFWININGYGSSHQVHNHPDAMLSGVFYIDIPDENTSNIKFYRDDDAEYYIPENMETYNNITSSEATYKPITGMLLIFPSWIKHGVTVNKSNKERIALSFNYGVPK